MTPPFVPPSVRTGNGRSGTCSSTRRRARRYRPDYRCRTGRGTACRPTFSREPRRDYPRGLAVTFGPSPATPPDGRAPVLAGLSALGEDADGIRAVESLSVPLGGGGVGGEMRVFVFKRPAVWSGRGSRWCAEVAAVGADEPELPRAGGQDLERSGVMGDVVTFTQGRQIGQVGTAA